MIILGLTGSIGMGKSTVAKHLSAKGLTVIDADAEVHKLYAGAAVPPIEAAFPGVTSDGRIDRGRLSALLLADPAGFKRLEAIIHPLVFEAERVLLQAAAKRGEPLAVLEVPLLFETGGDMRCDVTMLVSAGLQAQRDRVLARPGMTVEKLEAILKRQMPDADKRRRATHVIDTAKPLNETLADVDASLLAIAKTPARTYRAHWA